MPEFPRLPEALSWELDADKPLELEQSIALQRYLSGIDDARTPESASLAKSRFLAKVSHEIRTPMSIILGMCQLGRELDPPEPMAGYLERIEGAAMDQLRILEGILEYSRAEAGRIEIEASTFRLLDLLESAVGYAEELVRGRPISVVPAFRESTFPQEVESDPRALRQIMENLVSNAAKFTESGRIVVGASAGEPNDSGLLDFRFEVEDTGIGISEHQRSRLFLPFVQGDDSSTRRFGGTGLGLTTALHLVDRLGGDLAVDSRLGRGSRFTMRVPVRMPIRPAVPEFPKRTPGDRPLSGRRILVAEDNDQVQDLLKIFLVGLGAQAEFVKDGRKAVEACDRGTFDLVLMDIQMPVLDGLSAVREIRRRMGLRAPPVVALSADAFPEDKARCLAAGMSDHVAKPFSLPELLQAMQRNLAKA